MATGDSTFTPSYVSLDGKVLQFDAFTKEDVPEIPAEGYRVRQFNICYFLVDDSIRIGEVKQENSGIAQVCMYMPVQHDDLDAPKSQRFICR